MSESPEVAQPVADELPQAEPENTIPVGDSAENISADKPRRGRPPGLLPTPRVFDLPPEEFFRYWWALKKDDRVKRADVRAYRLWPIVDVLLELPPEEQDRIRKIKAQHRPAGPETNLGKDLTAEPIDPSIWEQEIYHRFGAGDYNFKLFDTEAKKGEGQRRPVCISNVRGLRDLDRYPPDCRPTIVVLDDPYNKRYVDWARSRGVQFPGDPGAVDVAAEAEAEVAEQKSSEILANTLGKVMDKMQEGSGKDSGMITVFGQMLTVLQNQQTAQMDAILKRLDAQEKAPPAAPPLNPADAVKPLVDLARTIANPAGEKKEDPMIPLLMRMLDQAETRRIEELKLADVQHARVVEMLTKRLDSTESQMREMTTKQQAAASTPGGMSELKQFFKHFNDIREGFENVAGKENGGPWWMGPVENLGEKLLDTAKMFAASRGPVAPPPQQQAPTAPQQRPQVAPPAQQPQQPTQEDQAMAMMDQVMEVIHPVMIQALERKEKGYEFAGRLMATYGADPRFQLIYNTFVVSGVNGLIGQGGVLQRNPQRWGELLRFGQALEQFVTEFLDTGRAQQVAEAIKTGGAGQPSQAQAPPVNGTPSDQPQRKGRVIHTASGPVETRPPDAA